MIIHVPGGHKGEAIRSIDLCNVTSKLQCSFVAQSWVAVRYVLDHQILRLAAIAKIVIG